MTTPLVPTWKPSRALATQLVVVLVTVLACTSTDSVPTAEIRAQEINKTVMCPVCPGESIDQSQHPLAVQMRGIVDEKLHEGWTSGQIREFFVERYGPSVLLEPPRQGFNWLVWVVPPVGVVGGGLTLYLVLNAAVRSTTRRRETLADEIELTQDEKDYYFHRIESALAFEASDGATTDSEKHCGER